MMLKLRKMKEKKGFTLIELMIVVAILGVLAAVAIPQYLNYIATSKRRATLQNFEGAKRIVAGEFARFDAGNLAKDCALLVDELHGLTTTQLVIVNFNPYTKAPNVAFVANAVPTLGEVGLTCTIATAGQWTSADTVKLDVAYLDETGAAATQTMTLVKE